MRRVGNALWEENRAKTEGWQMGSEYLINAEFHQNISKYCIGSFISLPSRSLAFWSCAALLIFAPGRFSLWQLPNSLQWFCQSHVKRDIGEARFRSPLQANGCEALIRDIRKLAFWLIKSRAYPFTSWSAEKGKNTSYQSLKVFVVCINLSINQSI